MPLLLEAAGKTVRDEVANGGFGEGILWISLRRLSNVTQITPTSR